jgi:hypothetical protein
MIEYVWYEGDHEEILLGKNVNREEFEKDLIEAKGFALSLVGKQIKEGDYLGKGYGVECLPEYYRQIVWFLVNRRGYFEACYDSEVSYKIEDFSDTKIEIVRIEKTMNSKEL